MSLAKDGDGLIFTTVQSTDQTELCDYIVIGKDRFYRKSVLKKKILEDAENERQAHLRSTNPSTGHSYGCSCFICNH